MAGQSGGPGYFATISSVYSAEGFGGFYRGWLPPFIGSIVYRSTQFTVYEMFWTKAEEIESMKECIPGSSGMQWRVLFGGITAGTARALIECPFEYAKVKR